MTDLLTIGDFSRMTFLSVKALRHYHDVGLLVPARVDEHSGYRYYATDQVATAHVIRRLRALDMPVEGVRSVLTAPDRAALNDAVAAHLDRMSAQLRETQETVDSLRRMLTTPGPGQVSYRDEPATTALAIRETVQAQDWVAWWLDAFTVLHRVLRSSGLTRSGPDGALFPTPAFTEEVGELVAYVPVEAGGGFRDDRVELVEIPAARLAVTEYDGPMVDLDQAYSAVGLWVAEQARTADGPVRERYLPRGASDDLLDHLTEVGWPIG